MKEALYHGQIGKGSGNMQKGVSMFISPAMLGAYIWHLRADHGDFAAANIHQDDHAVEGLQCEASMRPTASNQNQARRFGRTGSGLGIFIFLLMQFLLTEHERNMLLLAMIVALALVVAIAFAVKAFKNTSG